MHFLLCNLTGPGLFWAVKDFPRCLASVCRSSGPEDVQVTKTKFAWFVGEFKFLWTWQDCYIYLFGKCFHKNILWLIFWKTIQCRNEKNSKLIIWPFQNRLLIKISFALFWVPGSRSQVAYSFYTVETSLSSYDGEG